MFFFMIILKICRKRNQLISNIFFAILCWQVYITQSFSGKIQCVYTLPQIIWNDMKCLINRFETTYKHKLENKKELEKWI